ncbi:F-box/kelch-repeat protein At3g23880-like [Amaranthus tricolor]|uniref:F-box/kelch-repeat protein At3g23880-like n=1 Tax=Amaranthus tricolor TaxID=29722 RepID=UPI0025878608|nr:F-box/kelch-repeat protein At3g23880-like [Amaranthus tricolor]
MNTSTSMNFSYYDLPFDIVSDILARLPVNTLLEFRVVCTSWRTYIDSPSFISKHRNLYNKNHSKNSHLLIAESTRQLCLQRVTNDQTLTTLAFLPPFSPDIIIPLIWEACNGLFLISVHADQRRICLWNPFLRKSLILPPCPIVTPFLFVHYVIGFSPSCDDYKVLAFRIRTIIQGYEYEPTMAVYSLKHHLWTIKINPMNVDAWTSLRDPFSCDLYVYCGGIVYWFTKVDPEIIHAFDFNTEEFKNVPVPEPLKESKNLILFTIGELLAVISLPCILVLEEHDGEYTWREWCSDSWIQNVFDILEEHYSFTPKVFFVEESSTFLIIGFWGKIQFYEISSKKLELLRNGDGNFLFGGAYVETLALLTGNEGMIFEPFP